MNSSQKKKKKREWKLLWWVVKLNCVPRGCRIICEYTHWRRLDSQLFHGYFRNFKLNPIGYYCTLVRCVGECNALLLILHHHHHLVILILFSLLYCNYQFIIMIIVIFNKDFSLFCVLQGKEMNGDIIFFSFFIFLRSKKSFDNNILTGLVWLVCERKKKEIQISFGKKCIKYLLYVKF